LPELQTTVVDSNITYTPNCDFNTKLKSASSRAWMANHFK